jgi:predicted aldo/keto reductase-like oxidoreductase
LTHRLLAGERPARKIFSKESFMPKNKINVERRAFLKKGLAGLAAVGTVPAALRAATIGQAAPAAAAARAKPIVRTLGKTGLKIPVVSMGVMNADNPAVVRAALDGGIYLLDTAYGYQRGRNEEMIGQVIKGRPRDSFIIATKIPGPNRDKSMQGQPADAVIKSFLDKLDTSLQRLGLDSVEILYLHNNTTREDALNETMMEALEKAKKSGKVRFVGLSTHSGQVEVIRGALEAKIYDVVLAAYNFRQDYRDDLRKAIADATQAGMGIIAMKTLAGAFWDRERQQPINVKAALKWVLNDPNVTTAIPGLTTFDQLQDDLAVMTDITMTPQEIQDLRLGEPVAGLYCQQCGQCVPGCSRALPIPSLMRGYMYAYGYRNLQAAHELVSSLDLPADPCRSCVSCTARCVKGFDISDRVKDISRLRAVPADIFA